MKKIDNKTILLIILALFIPPLAVFLKKGTNRDFFINLILYIICSFPYFFHIYLGITGLFYILVIAHAIWVLLSKPKF